jgi:uncharacterized membrane protein
MRLWYPPRHFAGYSMATAATASAPKRSQLKLISFAAFAVLTIVVIYLKNGQILNPNSRIARHFAPAKWYLAVHAFFGILAMAVAAFQFSNRLRARYLKMHRFLGYVYVTSVFISAPVAIVLAMKVSTLSLTAASAMQSLGWMVTTGIALYCVRHGNIAQHRRWMVRSYPFAMVFTAVRAILPLPAVARLGPTGREAVVWLAIALAAFLPDIFLDWRAITSPTVRRKTA